MACILLLFALIASAPSMTEIIPKMAIVAATTPVGQAAIDAATKRNGRVFATYIVLLVISALLIAYFTWLTWDSGNKVQDAIQAEASARIGEATQKASEADERSKTLEASNLVMRSQVATLETKAAEQQTRAAKAELALLELQEHNKPRHLSSAEESQIANSMRQFAGLRLNLFAYGGDNEVIGITNELIKALGPTGAGLSLAVSQGSEVGRAVGGILVEVKPNADAQSQSAAAILAKALTEVRLATTGPFAMRDVSMMRTGKSDPNATIRIVIGKKP